MIAAVFDCMIFLQAAINDQGPAFACLEFAESNHVQLYLSPMILAELRDVLTRSTVKAKFPHLTVEYADIFVQRLAMSALVLTSVPHVDVSIRDPDDLPYRNLAIAANAQ